MYIREKEAELSVSASQKQWILEVYPKADNIANCWLYFLKAAHITLFKAEGEIQPFSSQYYP